MRPRNESNETKQQQQPVTENQTPAPRRPLPPAAKKALRVLAVLLVLAVLYGAAAGVTYAVQRGSSPVGEEELVSRMEELVPKAAGINEIIWGDGISADPSAEPALDTVTGPQYRAVVASSPYHSVAELRAAVKEVYSEAFISDTIAHTLFEGVEGDEKLEGISPRYRDIRVVADDGTVSDDLGVDITYKSFDLRAKLRPETARFVSREMVWGGLWWTCVRITVAVEEEYDGKISTRNIVLRRENGAWMLDSATY